MSEMTFVRAMLKGERKELAILRRAPNEACFGVQIATNAIDEGVRAGLKAADAGADWLDLNVGCPIYEASRRGLGAVMLRKPRKLARLVEGMASQLPIPLTVKARAPCGRAAQLCATGARACSAPMLPALLHSVHFIAALRLPNRCAQRVWPHVARVSPPCASAPWHLLTPLCFSPAAARVQIRIGENSSKINVQEVTGLLQQAGAAAVSIHGRTTQARYKNAADWELIQQVAAAHEVPVIGNGDVLTHYEAARRVAHSGCLAVMVGRGALIKPWIFQARASPCTLCG
jgi:tRNA-dihydrouridine synthase